jgi:hypothetical protein
LLGCVLDLSEGVSYRTIGYTGEKNVLFEHNILRIVKKQEKGNGGGGNLAQQTTGRRRKKSRCRRQVERSKEYKRKITVKHRSILPQHLLRPEATYAHGPPLVQSGRLSTGEP